MSSAFPLPAPDLRKVALLLDVDGTILDIARSPREVSVPPALYQTLQRLWDRTAGALAFVSGRPIRDLDRIFSPLRLPAIGGHGAEDVVPNRTHELGLRFCVRHNFGIERDPGKRAVKGGARDPAFLRERPKRGNEFAEARLMRLGGFVAGRRTCGECGA